MAFNFIVIFFFIVVGLKVVASGLNSHDHEHLQSHVNGELDLSLMSEEELRFLYFQSHDSESNNKLDGNELVQSLLHFHAEEAFTHNYDLKIFSDAELSLMIDPLLALSDKNLDGFIDYPEFVAGPAMIAF